MRSASRIRMLTIAAAFALSAGVAPASVVMLDFEHPDLAVISAALGGIEQIAQDSFLLFASLTASGQGMQVASSDLNCWPGNQTARLIVPGYSHPTLSRFDGKPFRLISADLAEFSCVLPQAQRVQFRATKADGSIFDWSFTTDGLAAFDGRGNDFQTVLFPGEFDNLKSVEFIGSFSADNFVLSVPEPSGALHTLAGAAAILGRRNRHQKVSKS